MMTKKVIMIFIFAILLSCEKEEVEVEKFHFYISIKDFALEDRFINNNEDIPPIVHRFAGGSVSCTNNTDTFLFDTQEISIENFLFEVPAGIYRIEVESPAASFYGQSTPSFMSEAIDVEISDLTDTIAVSVEPTCALIVVKDDENQLENGAFIIESRSLENEDFISYPLELDSVSNSYYTYLSPDTVPEIPNAFLWFYGEGQGGEKGGLHTEVFEIGYQYLIKVLE